MSISDIRIGKKNLVVYIFITLFCIIFTLIYEKFSYGEYSWYMRGMFLYPFIGGVIASMLLWKKNKPVERQAVEQCDCYIYRRMSCTWNYHYFR